MSNYFVYYGGHFQRTAHAIADEMSLKCIIHKCLVLLGSNLGW